MRKLKNLFRRPEFHILVFFFSLILFSWPFVGMTKNRNYEFVFIFLFSVWAGVIFTLFLISRTIRIPPGRQKDEKRR